MRFSSPILTASGCAGTGRELASYVDLSMLGGFVTRTITLDPRTGTEGVRVAETPSGLVNTAGLQNPGISAFLAGELPWLVREDARVWVSIAGASPGEYADLAKRLQVAPGVTGLELNLSAPDMRGLGLYDVREPFHASTVVAAVRRETQLPLLVKIRSDVVRVVETARTVAEAGADAVVVGNALPASMPDGRAAGLSGPAIGPLALRCVTQVVAELPDLPVIGCGGVATSAHVRSFLRAGALAVQVGTAQLHDPTTLARLVHDLQEDS